MEIFLHNGHLTDEALASLAAGAELTETTRLEIAEHLAYCDLCLQRYTDALEGVPLLTPEHSCRESLWIRVRTRAFRLLTSRYATAAAAIVLALTLVWGSGYEGLSLPGTPAERHTVSDGLWKWNQSLDNAISGVNEFFDGLSRQALSGQGGN